MNSATSPVALKTGAITACYLALSSLPLFLNIQWPWTLPLMPGLFLLLAPAPLLAAFGLGERSWLIGTWPTGAGVIILIGLYSALAWATCARVAGLQSRSRGLEHK